MTANQIAYQRMLEEKRHNLIGEGETERAHRAQEKISMDTAKIKAYTDIYNQNTKNATQIGSSIISGVANIGGRLIS